MGVRSWPDVGHGHEQSNLRAMDVPGSRRLVPSKEKLGEVANRIIEAESASTHVQLPLGFKSKVRVKMLVVFAIFAGGWLLLLISLIPKDLELWVFAAMMFVSMLPYFIRCERCHYSLISLRPDRVLSHWRALLPPKRCPKCGLESL